MDQSRWWRRVGRASGHLFAGCVLGLTLSSLAFASSAPKDAASLFGAMALQVKPGEQARFVVGDHVDGYFEGFTHSHEQGEGYVLKAATVLKNYTALVDGKPALRSAAGARETVFPYGRLVQHRSSPKSSLEEEMAVLGGQTAVSVTLRSNALADLGVRLQLAAGEYRTTQIGNALVLIPSSIQAGKAGPVMALASDAPWRSPELGNLNSALPSTTIQLQSRQPVRSFTVVAAFADTPLAAAEKAQQLAANLPLQTEKNRLYARLSKSMLWTDDALYNQALLWASAAADLFVVQEFGSGIWAGLPWFRDNWGRDTFIALPGTLLVSGQFSKAKTVLENFARYQNLQGPHDGPEYGRIPNRVSSADGIIYNTVDGTPWMLREALETIRYTGDQEFARAMYQLARQYFEGAIAHYLDADGLLKHDEADTWMDARIEGKQAWAARGSRAVEIQALWYTALQSGALLAEQVGEPAQAAQWRALATKCKDSFLRLFWDGKRMADRLREDGSADTKVRPNQLMLISIPDDAFVPDTVQAHVLRNAVSELLYPYGIASLSQNDVYFHPRHVNPEFHHKDAAYHQGTVWGWNAGFTVSALNKFGYQDHAYALSRNLGKQILGRGLKNGTLGTMSELLDALPDAHGKLQPSGTFAQSWSVAEFARNAYQDYVGFKPDLLANTLHLTPAIPRAWRRFEARLPFGQDEYLNLTFVRKGDNQIWRVSLQGQQTRRLVLRYLRPDQSRAEVEIEIKPGPSQRLFIRAGRVTHQGRRLASRAVQASYAKQIGRLQFQTPKPYRPQDFPMLQAPDVLKGIVERNEYR